MTNEDGETQVCIAPPVSLAVLAAETGFGTNGFRRALLARGFVPFQIRRSSNAPYYIGAADAEAFKKVIEDERRLAVRPSEQVLPERLEGVYLIEVPSYGGQVRVKIGWADSFEDRLASYRTIVPDLRILALWPTRDEWMERAALRLAENTGSRIFTELFEFEDNLAAVTKLKEFFASMGVQTIGEAAIQTDDQEAEIVERRSAS